MRAASLGVIFPNETEQREAYNQAHTKLTHSDPKALYASQLVADIAASFVREELDIQSLLKKSGASGDHEWKSLLDNIQNNTQDTLKKFGIKNGVSGYSYHTVPAVVYVGIKNDWNYKKTLVEIISLGGDTDSTAAIAGALCALHPKSGEIPKDWKDNLCEFPLSVNYIETRELENGFYHWRLWPLFLVRNFFQLIVVVGHVLLRWLPTPIMKTLIP